MDFLQEFNRIMTDQGEIALATSVNDTPNVRIVNFYYNTQKKGILYFSTFRNNPKTKEFSQNNRVAFTTVPIGNNEQVRVNTATVQKSVFTIYDFKDAFSKKIPDYEMTIEQVGKQLDLYEIHFENASVTLDMTQSGTVAF
ncbi:MAG: pyridoxamine 5'-phosphate oxidase family protein [bacterium]|nr:pyridoxamine 5'-phosphate oxidase family protein [bacterium]